MSGEQYWFKGVRFKRHAIELLRERHEFMDMWHPADCIGETGAAVCSAAGFGLSRRASKATPPAIRCSSPQATMTDGGLVDRVGQLKCLMANEVYANSNEISCKSGTESRSAPFPTCA